MAIVHDQLDPFAVDFAQQLDGLRDTCALWNELMRIHEGRWGSKYTNLTRIIDLLEVDGPAVCDYHVAAAAAVLGFNQYDGPRPVMVRRQADTVISTLATLSTDVGFATTDWGPHQWADGWVQRTLEHLEIDLKRWDAAVRGERLPARWGR